MSHTPTRESMNILAVLMDELREAMNDHIKAEDAAMTTKKRVMEATQKLGEHQHAVGELSENVLVGYLNTGDIAQGISRTQDEFFKTPVHVSIMVEEVEP